MYTDHEVLYNHKIYTLLSTFFYKLLPYSLLSLRTFLEATYYDQIVCRQ